MTIRPDPSRSRAVLIGVSEYAEPRLWPSLPAVKANLVDLAAALCDPAGWALPSEHCTVLHNPRQVREVINTINEAAKQAEDFVLVYYVGHGSISDTELLLTLRDTTYETQGWDSVPYPQVRDRMKARRAQRALVVLDCCFSGRAHTLADTVSAVQAQINPTSAYVLTSSAADQQSLSPPDETHTAFTGRLLEVMRDGVSGVGEWLSLADISRAVATRLAADGLPTPRSSQSDQGEQIALVRNRRWSPVPTGVDPTGPVLSVIPPPGDDVALGADQVAGYVKRVFGPLGTPVLLVNEHGDRQSCPDAPAVVRASRAGLAEALRGMRLVGQAVQDARTAAGDGAASAALMTARLIEQLSHHPVYRRRQLVADCAGLTTQLVQRLTDAALPATLEALAAAGATAAHDPALGPSLLGWLGGVAGPAAVRFECPANVIWPDLRWREAVFERPSVLIVDGDVNDATPYVRLPRDRKWLVAVGKVAMSVRRTLQSNVRGNWLAVAQIAPGESRPQVLGHLSRLAAAAGTDVNQAGEEPTAIGSVVLARLTSASLVVEAGSAASGDPMRADRRSDETVEAYVARSARLSRVERVIDVARQTGVLPGGGAALRWHGADIARGVSDPVLANVFRAVTSAPLLALLPAAEDVASRVAAVDQSSHGYDPVRGDVVDLASNGVLDPCGVVVAALRATIDAGSRYAEI